MDAIVISTTFFLSCAAAVIAIAIQIGRVARVRASSTHEAVYQQLVRESNEAQQRMAQALDAAVAEIKSLRTRAESMEKLLQEVG
ncbi:MAG: hypothetical protein WCL53_05630 [Chloroflexota bacterium]